MRHTALTFSLLALLPSLAEARQSCTSKPELATVTGLVIDASTRLPLQLAPVSVTWHDARRDRVMKREVETDLSGRFEACDVAVGTDVVVLAEFFGRDARSRPVVLEAGARADETLELDAPQMRVRGRVLDDASGQPIAAAAVSIGADGPARVSDERGQFLFEGLPSGRFVVAVSHVAFTAVTDSLDIEPGTISDLTVRLAPNVIALEPLLVEVRSLRLESAGFYDRQERGMGSYITRDRIEAVMAHVPSDVLRTEPGLRLIRRGFGSSYVVVGRADCPFRYFVDGTRVGPTFQIDDLDAEWIEAIEIYRGAASIPPQFVIPPTQENANCGVIAVWTRVR